MNQLSRRMCWAPLVAASPLAKADGRDRVATGQAGQTAFEFIGIIRQNGGDFTMSGYLTAISGLPESKLFTGPATRSKDTARFSLEVSANMVSRNVLDPLYVLHSQGRATISYHEFVGGNSSPVASGPLSVQTTVQLTTGFTAQAPGKGNFRASGQFTLDSAHTFTLGGVSYHFGETGLALLLTISGDITLLSNPQTPVSQIIVGGNAIYSDDASPDHGH